MSRYYLWNWPCPKSCLQWHRGKSWWPCQCYLSIISSSLNTMPLWEGKQLNRHLQSVCVNILMHFLSCGLILFFPLQNLSDISLCKWRNWMFPGLFTYSIDWSRGRWTWVVSGSAWLGGIRKLPRCLMTNWLINWFSQQCRLILVNLVTQQIVSLTTETLFLGTCCGVFIRSKRRGDGI